MPRDQFFDRPFWLKVVAVLERVVALIVFGIVHYVLNSLVRFIAPFNMRATALLLEDIFFVVFCLVYVYLAWDMLTAVVSGYKSNRMNWLA